MRVMSSDLAILSAERYDDGCRPHRAASNAPGMKKAISSAGGGDRSIIPKKRTRKQSSVDHDEPDEEKKRARGRPRLDTTDQTPQEAGFFLSIATQPDGASPYRDRKESAITNLEREVESLKATNVQMTQAYQDVLDFAASNGLLDAKSELGLRLMKLEELAKKSNDAYDDYDGSSPGDGNDDPKLPGEVRRQSVPSASSGENTGSSGSSAKQVFAKSEPTQQLWAGVMVTHEPVNEIEAAAAAPQGQQQLYSTTPLYDGPSSHPPGPIGYEIIAQPTSQNASFAPQLSFDPSSYGIQSWTPSPWTSLPSPSSLAYQEQSFARRLHRTALQRAARLITMKDPPSDKILRVFGFARLFETLEQIRGRTLDLLTRSERETLFNQGYPFQHLGGTDTGTQFPPANEADHGHDTSSPTMRDVLSWPKDEHAVTMGPMDPRLGKIRETLVSLGGQINLPGFDGHFWDPDEVQIYLMHNGVEIPPAVDHHVVELEDGAFGPPPSQVQNEEDRPQFAEGRRSSSSTAPGAGAGTNTMSGLCSAPITTVVASARLAGPLSSRPDAISVTPNTANAASLWPHGHSAVGHFTLPAGSAACSAMPVFPTHPFPGQNALGFPVEMAGSNYSCDPTGPLAHHDHGTAATKRSWRINVEEFLHQLLIKMTCLGRSPGIRPKDVDMAFWASVTDLSTA
ncbi:hypothetical protein PG993_005674 [Apiospora rasikravindrae]|uniref:Uncharacterized protein n=1 Tax=Apiospora rasikravindrae TaxID=990691 RepID=A0ABR1TI78_9PEZI